MSINNHSTPSPVNDLNPTIPSSAYPASDQSEQSTLETPSSNPTGGSGRAILYDITNKLSSPLNIQLVDNNHSLVSPGATSNGDCTYSPTSLSDSLASLYLPVPLRQLTSSIMSGLGWINQLELRQSAVLQYINTLNPFRRRASTISLKQNSSSANTDTESMFEYNSKTLQNKSIASILNNSEKTLKKSELIELSSFGLVEIEDLESGIGHEFKVNHCCEDLFIN